ncbi:MAG: exodeoxyribonuclease VII small subunit [Bacteroidales bacterium]|jgi:exodeoxyribonuclease VII small subunit|nr:exodeoxyribonuclease VII small subunit [Bacteroidales bacterium]MDD2280329.1 exodeoxyribonuclease VII small subunit [Bacteroidales bacterium]MDD4293016.1 exodeoxyribonuclease VII small subunit [Bacteroidales bacterium]MDD4491117.1 exodeoxyribonuclease VII small subunit [Bacteroidales bacterium]HNW48138.1 exodeoxyribonuclease VII small subunit [Bacteroidales bacterium]
MKKNKDVVEKSYKEALKELEELVVKIEDPSTNIEEISAEVKRALELVNYCQLQLRSYKEEIDKLTKKQSND